MSETFWLRGETKHNEFRRALTPNNCSEILADGHTIYIEDWKESIIHTHEYTKVGCLPVAANSWYKEAPDNAIIVGIKELPNSIPNFKHTHIYFAHVYKEQAESAAILEKFKLGGGKLIDLEYMTDSDGRRVCAFGYWAGYIGAALGALYCKTSNKDQVSSELQHLKQFANKQELIGFVNKHTNQKGKAIVIGSKGRSGHGAIDFLNSIGWQVMGWDLDETISGGPFKEILNYDLFVNCVLSTKKISPFITKNLIEKANVNLKVISDVTCDPDSDCNVIPLYTEATKLNDPIIQVTSGNLPVQLIAIDNLPSILPCESSYDFSNQLSPFIRNYSESTGPILNALNVYEKHSK
jgi:saccharopine dehydrogenase (NAD+, L-lysine forming)